MKSVFALIVIVLVVGLAACTTPPPHQQGGEASAELPALPPGSRIALKQPENPEGASQIGYKDRRVIT